MDNELRQGLDSLEKLLSERIDRTEAKLLTAFHDWARTYEARARGTTRAIHTFEERLGSLEERLALLERASINPKAWKSITHPPDAACL